MTIRFIIGRAGTGKTRYCLDGVRAELLKRPVGSPLILLVPEQATFQTEYALASTPELKGFVRAHVLSFRRLAYRILQEVGGAVRAHLGELGKRMVLRRLLEQRRSELKVFRRSAGQPGFAETLARTLGEMKTYCVGPPDLAHISSALRGGSGASLLADKLEDLTLLYDDLETYLADRFTDPEDYLNLLADRLESAPSVQGAEVWVDGFSGFTPQEYRVLAVLARAAGRVNIALCTDAGSLCSSPRETDLFYPIRETYDNLCSIAAREHIPVERPVNLDVSPLQRYKNTSISRIEKYYFDRTAQPDPDIGQGVILSAAANPLAEVEGVAREITSLCRDRGYKYRDIVVLLRDIGPYAQLISSVFADHKIPVFIDEKRPVMHHPLVELVRSALEVVVRDWSYDPVFRYLKTDLTPLSREEVDLLENYVLAHGIRGSRWVDGIPWEYRRRLTLEEEQDLTDREAEELETIHRIRQQTVTELSRFQKAVAAAGNVRAVTIALFTLLTGLQVPELLERWSQRAEEQGLLEVAREHTQVWGGLTELLDQVVESLGDQEITLSEYAAVLDAGLESLRLGMIPPGLDQVVVGSLERSRSPEARAAFVLRVSDGMLPARVTEQGILSEAERDRLQVMGLNLAPGAQRKIFDEQYLIYIALTRSSERLLLSYPLADHDGGAIMPSPVVARLKELLPCLEERVWPVEPNAAVADDLEFVTNPGRALSYLAAQLREAGTGRPLPVLWQDIYSWFARSDYRARSAQVLSGLFFNNQEGRLSPGLGRALYGRILKTSVSSVERFGACPFAHFLSHGLKLQERAIYKLGAPDLGQFFHAALKLFGESIREKGLDWGQLEKEQCLRLAGEAVDVLAPRLQSEILLSSARRRYLTGKLKKTVQRAALVLTEHSRRGKFRPVGLELYFGPGGEIPSVTFTLSDGSEMLLNGRIDRIDAAPCEDGVYLRIIDYKSGKTTIHLSEIYHGLKLQLLAYLDVAMQHARSLTGGMGLPGAVLYFRIDDPLIKTSGEVPSSEELDKKILKELRMTGMVLADPSVIRLMDDGLMGESDLIPVYIKKEEDIAARSAVLTQGQFEMLRVYLRSQLRSTGDKIMGGVVDISPYRRGAFRPCQNCPYKPVCQFDVLIDGNTYRNLRPEDKDKTWGKIAEALEGEGFEQ